MASVLIVSFHFVRLVLKVAKVPKVSTANLSLCDMLDSVNCSLLWHISMFVYAYLV